MAKSFEDAIGGTEISDTRIRAAVEKIDKGLIPSQACGSVADHFWQCVVFGELNTLERVEIETIYRAAGWGAVKSITSSENGERPGLTMFTLYQRADSAYLKM